MTDKVGNDNKNSKIWADKFYQYVSFLSSNHQLHVSFVVSCPFIKPVVSCPFIKPIFIYNLSSVYNASSQASSAHFIIFCPVCSNNSIIWSVTLIKKEKEKQSCNNKQNFTSKSGVYFYHCHMPEGSYYVMAPDACPSIRPSVSNILWMQLLQFPSNFLKTCTCFLPSYVVVHERRVLWFGLSIKSYGPLLYFLHRNM